MYVIIPDIHGDYERLEKTLIKAGFERGEGLGWSHPNNTKAVFLGDFIDSGKENRKVISTVRAMLDTDDAHAIMGNHEFNAIMYHTPGKCSQTGRMKWLRARSEAHKKQHCTFLEEFIAQDDDDFRLPESAELVDVLDWFKTLPLYLEFDAFRIVHAQWDAAQIARLLKLQDGSAAFLPVHALEDAIDLDVELGFALERILKGMEVPLPNNGSFLDFCGNPRTDMRVKWWAEGDRTYKNLALSVPDTSVLPDEIIPDADNIFEFEHSGKPVFVGHYKMYGKPEVGTDRAAICLDYPQQACFYHWMEGDTEIRDDRLILV